MKSSASADVPDRPSGAGSRVVLLAVLAATLALLLVAPIAPALLAADGAVDAIERDLLDHPPLPDELPPAEQGSTVLDVDGQPITRLHGPIEREPAALDDISPVAVDAVIATEDAEFYDHDGVNHESIVRAGVRNVQAGGIAEGASTITQQLVTLAFLTPEPTIERKLHEIVWAVELEEQSDKDDILEHYLNRIYLGNGIYGINTAAEHYFSKPASELELAEAALLAGTIRAPTINNPVDDPEAAATRRDVVLRQMQSLDMIDAEQADEIVGTEVEVDLREDEAGEPFWEDLVKRVIYDPDVDLQPGLQESVADDVPARVEALFEGGLEIQTTLDRSMHARAHEVLSDYVDDPASDPMGSLLTVDHSSGALRAMALGPKEFGPCDQESECATTQVNPVVPGIGGSGRQAGSAFKPFVAAAALDRGEQVSQQYTTPSGEEIDGCGWDEPWRPANFDLNDHGEIDMAEAMRDSTNVYFAKLTRDTGVSAVVETARAHGLGTIPDLGERDCAIGLGATEVFPWQIVAGYGVWANGGRLCEPYLVERVLDRDGQVLYEHEPDCERVLDEDTAATVSGLLDEPVSSGGTAAVVGNAVDGAVGKTGTTDNFRDAWFVGSAGTHTTAAWLGFEQPDAHPQGMRGITVGGQHHARVAGGTVPAPMWADLMDDL